MLFKGSSRVPEAVALPVGLIYNISSPSAERIEDLTFSSISSSRFSITESSSVIVSLLISLILLVKLVIFSSSGVSVEFTSKSRVEFNSGLESTDTSTSVTWSLLIVSVRLSSLALTADRDSKIKISKEKTNILLLFDFNIVNSSFPKTTIKLVRIYHKTINIALIVKTAKSCCKYNLKNQWKINFSMSYDLKIFNPMIRDF